MKTFLTGAALAALATPAAVSAQAAHDHHAHQPAAAPQTPAVSHDGHDAPQDAAPADVHAGHSAGGNGLHEMVMTSGTSLLPATDAFAMPVFALGDWSLMAHGYAWAFHTDQGGPRGDDGLYVASMAMVQANRPIGERAGLQLRAMVSADPLMGRRGYPNLLATGETAFGRPLVDRQHPHDLFMELSARIDREIGKGVGAFLYGGPVAEPAIGPTAFMHRRSARLNPEAPITHHWFDSTHITYGVVTAGVRTRRGQIEVSAFRGREPDEERWGIEAPRFDSWSVRASWTPTDEIVTQVSFARLEKPEALHPDEDEARTTASIAWGPGPLAVTAAWSRKNRLPGPVLNAYLVEANLDVTDRHGLFGRYENVANDELFDHDSPLHGRAFRVAKATLGYGYTLPLGRGFNLAMGGSASVYGLPAEIEPFYGRFPVSTTVFAKLVLGR